MVTFTFSSWNQTGNWLTRVDGLRQAALKENSPR
jgi:hypothetical protein